MPREAGYSSRIQSRTTGAEKTQDRSFYNSPAVEASNPFGSPEASQTRSVLEYKNALWEIEESASDSPACKRAIILIVAGQIKQPRKPSPFESQRCRL